MCSLIELNSDYLMPLADNPLAAGQLDRGDPDNESKDCVLQARSMVMFAHAIADDVAPIEFRRRSA
jgi:hypothetical protein